MSLLTNTLHISFLYFIVIRWTNQTPFSQSEKIIFTFLHLCLSLLKMKEQVFRVYYVNPFAQKIGNSLFFKELNLGIITGSS